MGKSFNGRNEYYMSIYYERVWFRKGRKDEKFRLRFEWWVEKCVRLKEEFVYEGLELIVDRVFKEEKEIRYDV